MIGPHWRCDNGGGCNARSCSVLALSERGSTEGSSNECHPYWEFNEYTNWVFPLYEQPFTGGVPGSFAASQQYNRASLFPGSGPSGVSNQNLPNTAGSSFNDHHQA